jgi:osmoprotectant transport system ATP-binding protein
MCRRQAPSSPTIIAIKPFRPGPTGVGPSCTEKKTMIRLRNVCKSFDGEQNLAVRHLSFSVEDGEILVLLGTSGCGKTTTLKMINRLIEPDSGLIEVDGVNILERNPQELRRTIGYAFQGIGLFPHMTVADNVAVVLRLCGKNRRERRKRAEEMLELVALDPRRYADSYPDHLSGGQQQRVGVARALAADPKYLLMDEPFGALDALTRDTLQKEFLALTGKLRKTVIFVTHDILEALALADRIAVMHEGRLEQIGSKAEILRQPETAFVQDLFAKPIRQLQNLVEQY